MRKMSDTADKIGFLFGQLHRTLQQKNGRLSSWTGNAAEVFAERENNLYTEAAEVLEHLSEENLGGGGAESI